MKIRKELADKAVGLICACPAFLGADETEIRFVLAGENSIVKEFSKGQAVFPCHGINKAVGFILTGSCHLCRDNRITALLESGSFFGVESIYSSSSPKFTLSAAENCKVLFLKQAAVDDVLKKSTAALHSFLSHISDRIIPANKKSELSLGRNGEKVLAEYLLSRPKNSKNEVEMPQDLLKIAKQLNLGKDGLFKAIEKLNSSGVIVFNGRAICIADEEKLKKFTEDNTD